MKKSIIGIIGIKSTTDDNDKITYVNEQTRIDLISKNCVPILLTTSKEFKNSIFEQINICDGIVVPDNLERKDIVNYLNNSNIPWVYEKDLSELKIHDYDKKIINKPIIGILTRPAKSINNVDVEVLWGVTGESLIKSNAIPIGILPPQKIIYYETKTKDIQPLKVDEINYMLDAINLCDGFFLQGGDRWYEYDRFLINHTVKKDIPTLCVCMSMQLLAAIDNQSENNIFYPNIKIDTKINHQKPDDKYVHDISIEKNTKLYSIINNENIIVNSKHSYCIPKVYQMKICAKSTDGLIEGIEYDNKKFIVGVQWHPESMVDYDDAAKKLIDYFINSCKKETN